MDLSQFDATPLIEFIAAKETNYGTETNGRISSRTAVRIVRSSGLTGIAKLLSPDQVQPDPSLSGGHLAGIVGPQAERICPCMTIGVSGEAIAAGLEDGVDLVMSCKETLRLSWRL